MESNNTCLTIAIAVRISSKSDVEATPTGVSSTSLIGAAAAVAERLPDHHPRQILNRGPPFRPQISSSNRKGFSMAIIPVTALAVNRMRFSQGPLPNTYERPLFAASNQ